ncbi:MAG: UDP-4-amino-4-deoxy-L-arabinose--oxoglutarate aminotransferase [Candidatus Methanofastidiosum methylothiophilum]|uniref:UDP-4-amino-4-deoxy-L-arabinose--oxoglutarate aminotransferase n=1 Tax=Candidatus Methanofastidiosum methylothiophilum TaxID=1705564 RepID=A0A150IIV2_9EURY|nr:MAG: UDP-4-amino-4-deoxy-L-arabinose--oxoglutarate aminotransferase [Candidatus Methanofastidiosum methylthiophilus]
MKKTIPFSPPDISNVEIKNIIKVLKSGWITTGPKVRDFENMIKEYVGCDYAIAVNSATAAMELVLRMLDVKKGDEVITSCYTYAATANVIVHRGATPILLDVEKNSFKIDLLKLENAINEKTKVIMPVDFGGVPERYDEIKEILKRKNREDIVILADSAHSFGAKYKGKTIGTQADFHTFSFHAVKNLTTAEGGAIVFNKKTLKNGLTLDDEFVKKSKIIALHGQSKDAFAKLKPGAWEYDIIADGFKCNMTDIMAAFGCGQISRFDSMLQKRKKIHDIYSNELSKENWSILPFSEDENKTSTNYHLYPLRIKNFTFDQRNMLISNLANKGISTNVHFIPLPLFSFYKSIGFDIKDYPQAFNQYANEMSLPIYSTLSAKDAKFVVLSIIDEVKKIFDQK